MPTPDDVHVLRRGGDSEDGAKVANEAQRRVARQASNRYSGSRLRVSRRSEAIRALAPERGLSVAGEVGRRRRRAVHPARHRVGIGLSVRLALEPHQHVLLLVVPILLLGPLLPLRAIVELVVVRAVARGDAQNGRLRARREEERQEEECEGEDAALPTERGQRQRGARRAAERESRRTDRAAERDTYMYSRGCAGVDGESVAAFHG